MDSTRGRPTNSTTEMAKERSREAGERTVTSWIGICTLLIAFGAAYESNGRDATPYVGAAAVGFGIALVSWGALVHRRQLRELERPSSAGGSSIASLGAVAGTVVALGLFAFVALLLKAR